MKMKEQVTEAIPILKIVQLCKDFLSNRLWGEGTRVVDSVDLEVMPGEILGVVGESGSGKTTLARCSLRLIEPSSGSIYFDGQDLMSLGSADLRSKRKEFQMIFQDPYASLNPGMTVEQILREPLKIHKAGSSDYQIRCVRESLDAVSLNASLLKRKPAELSGGQQQRIGIARSLVLKPRLIVADEPVSALDVSVQAQILNLLADLKKHYNLTLVLISHSLHAIHYLCTDIAVLYKGRLVEEATATSFFKGPKHPYGRILLNSTLSLNTSMPKNSFPARMDVFPSNAHRGCIFYPHCPDRLPLCAASVPVLSEISAEAKVACFLYSQASGPQRRDNP